MSFRGALLKPSEKGERRPTASRSISKVSRYEIVKDKIKTWCEDRFKVGELLAELQRDKLYKEEYATFEECCLAEFGLKHSHAYGLIEAASVKDSLKTSAMADKITNERQARALAPVPVDQREEVLTKAAEAGPVTAKAITEAARVVVPRSTPVAKPEKEIHLDKTGYPIPESILEDWQRADEFRTVLNDLQRVKLLVEKGLEESDLIFREINQGAVADLKNAWSYLKQVLPYVVCPTCQGRTRSKCTTCKQRGFISRFAYEHWIPKQTRDLREKAVKK